MAETLSPAELRADVAAVHVVIRRQLLSLAVALIFSTCAAAQSAPAARENARTEAAVVAIVVQIGSTQAGGATNSSPPIEKVFGAGTIMSQDGFILTFDSLFKESGTIEVILAEGKKFEGRLVGKDRITGLALVKIEVQGLPFLKPEPAAELPVSTPIMAFGRSASLDENPSPIVAEGVVQMAYQATDPLKIIAASFPAVPGMGGGPVIRKETGEFVGVYIAQMVSRSGQTMELLTPVDQYLNIEADLKSKGRVERAELGISIAAMTKEASISVWLPEGKGVIVSGTESGGPADKAGITAGDIILAVGQKEVESAKAYIDLIRSYKSGMPIELTVFRRGGTLKITAIGEAAP